MINIYVNSFCWQINYVKEKKGNKKRVTKMEKINKIKKKKKKKKRKKNEKKKNKYSIHCTGTESITCCNRIKLFFLLKMQQ